MNILTPNMMNQKLDLILIETPMRQQLLTNTSLQSAHQKVIDDLKSMNESNFYEYINVHYGVKSKAEQNLNQRIYKRKKQIIEHKIKLQENYLKSLYRAQVQADLDKIQKQYQNNMKLVEVRQKQFDTSQFIPYIYIQAKKKKPAYGKIFQQFDRKGVAMLKATIGYRAPFSVHDKIQFSMQTPPTEYFRKRNYYEFGLNWLNPTNYFGGSTFSLGGSSACGPIFKGVDQKKYIGNLGFQRGDLRVQLQGAKRFPRLHDRIDKYCLNGYHIPTTKWSIKVDKTLADSLDRGQIMTGQITQTKIQTTIPYISQTQFVKAQYSHRKFYDIFSISRYFQNKHLKQFIKNSNLQTNFSVKAMGMKNHIVSDFIQNIQIRGFENDRRPKQSILQAKGSIKINNYNYPLFGSIGIIPFLYGQVGLTVHKNLHNASILGSTGVGLSFPLGKFIQLQVLYCLFQAQNKKNREPVNFQIRIGLMD